MLGLIVSKDRPAQLRLLLDSILSKEDRLFLFTDFVILYTYSNNEYKSGYDLLIQKKMDSRFRFIKEDIGNIKSQILNEIKESRSSYVCMLTDDSIIYTNVNNNFVTWTDIRDAFDKETVTFSLRYGFNTTIQYYKDGSLQPKLTNWPCDLEQKIPNKNDVPYLRWDYTKYPLHLNYGYWASMDGHIYQKDLLYELTNSVDFKVVRTWEGVLAGQKYRDLLEKRGLTKMASFEKSVLVNVPINCVQDPPLEISDTVAINQKTLNDRYLNGEIIDLDALDFSNIRGAHAEITFKFKKDE